MKGSDLLVLGVLAAGAYLVINNTMALTQPGNRGAGNSWGGNNNQGGGNAGNFYVGGNYQHGPIRGHAGGYNATIAW
jgi:hypothetical protein